ncbi:ABC transporter permease [Geomonas sp. Red875]|uniref:ABC transporter permease n=1 Tax=Geomesophilobacter sediminis TaxID=2798584 RepID=A0A8J7JKQ2_9BACT|nr:ABC transporter permease [Geomesophilobacter sediminis]
MANLLYVTLKSALRDRILHAMFGVSLVLLLLVPSLSVFSMRQVQELSITLSLSAVSVALLLLATLLGASSIWRDVERRYTSSILGLPISRGTYVLGKYAGIASVLVASAFLLGVASTLVIALSAGAHPSDMPVRWPNVWTAVVFDTLKYLLLAALAMLFSSLSTSFFLPFFGTISIYLAGSASQDVYEYITGPYGKTLSPVFRWLAHVVYYIIPNFSAFNLKVLAVYGLLLPWNGLLYTFCYFLVYTALVLVICVWIFSRRELP